MELENTIGHSTSEGEITSEGKYCAAMGWDKTLLLVAGWLTPGKAMAGVAAVQ